MNLWISFSLFSLAILPVWIFFLVAKMHVFKYKDYSNHVEPATKALFALLAALTVAGYAIVFTSSDDGGKKTTVAESSAVEEY